MNTILFAFLIVNAIDLLVMPFLGAKCRSGAKLDQSSTWLPFSSLYRVFVLVELAVASTILVGKPLMALVLFTLPFIMNWVALRGWILGVGTYTIIDPLTSFKDDVLRLKEHRFYPKHVFTFPGFMDGLEDNSHRYWADLALAAIFVKILFFL